MRLNVLFWLVMIALGGRGTFAAEFPFDGYIVTDEAEIASGPGRRFYTTARLPQGTKVEVYREDDAGWLAIRPPEGSFSWIPAEHVETLEDGVGKLKSAAECWIGTSVEQVKEHKSQVSLKAGELIEIIDRKQVATKDASEEWLKIAPPAGEFRFVHSRDVSRERVEPKVPAPAELNEETKEPSGEEQSSKDNQTEDSINAQSGGDSPRRFRPSDSAIALRDIDEVRSKLAAMREDLAGLAGKHGTNGVQLAQFQATTAQPLSPDGFVPRKRRTGDASEAEPFHRAPLQTVPVPSDRFTGASRFPRSQTAALSAVKLNPLPRVNSHSLPAHSIARSRETTSIASVSTDAPASQTKNLDALDLELSLMLAQDKSTWNLAGIRQQVEQLVERGATPADRGQARLLLDKIKQFEEAFAVGDQGPLSTAVAEANGASESSSAYAPRYDAKGWLKPVISRTKSAAPYAIVDQDGKPLCFVTPSPGLNLGRYANKEVGLYGTRGYIESLKTPHVVAERVIDLERHVR